MTVESSLPEHAREVAAKFEKRIQATYDGAPGVELNDEVAISLRDLRVLVEAATWWEDAALEVEYRWYRLQSESWLPSTPDEIVSFAQQFTALSDAHLALRTFLTGYDGEHDTMPWDRDED